MVIGMPRCGAHSLGDYLQLKYPDRSVVTDEFTFLTDKSIRNSNLDKALAESEVWIILRKDVEHWRESFEALIGKPPHESMIEFQERMSKFCKPKIVYLEDYMKLDNFPHVNKRNFNTHPKKLRELNEIAIVHMNRKNYS